MRSYFVALVALTACGDNQGKPIDAAMVDMMQAIDAPIDTLPADAPDPRNATYPLGNANSSNGIVWDAAASKLYLSESNANALLSWADAAHTFSIYTQFPLPSPATAAVTLGEVLKNQDGSFYITNFGSGGGSPTAGNIVKAPNPQAPMGTAVAITNAGDAVGTIRRRIGLARNPIGDVYAATFVGMGAGNQVGAITKIVFNGATATETTVVTLSSSGTAFKKLVGIVATDTAIFVTQANGSGTTDSPDNVIYKVALPLPTNSDPPTVTLVATVPNTDLLMMLPGGDLLTGGKTTVHRVTQAGVVTPLTALGTFEVVRGLAYDPAMTRLFIVNHSATVTTGDKLEIRPFTE